MADTIAHHSPLQPESADHFPGFDGVRLSKLDNQLQLKARFDNEETDRGGPET